MVESTATLTKSLRDKSKPLLDLLPTAQSIFQNEISIFFPGKEEWFVEWLVERLGDETSPDGRLSSETWKLLLDLLNTSNLNVTSATTSLRKHKFVEILAKTLSDAVARYESDENDTSLATSTSEDVDMHDAISSASSSATEPGSPLLRGAFGCKVHPQVQRSRIRRSREAQGLLLVVFKVVELLESWLEKAPGENIESPKRRRLVLSAAVLKGSPEIAASVVEAYFKLIYVMIQSLGDIEMIPNWTNSCQLIWKSASYGVSDFVKLASLTSEKLLPPISMLLSLQSIPPDLRNIASWFLGMYIFKPISGPKGEFLKTLKPLADACSTKDAGSNSVSIKSSLPVILELAIKKANRDFSVKQRRQIDGFVSTLISWMLSVAGHETSIHSRLLDIAIQHKVALEEEPLSSSLSLALRRAGIVDWTLLKAIARVDLDIIVSSAGDAVFSRISEFDTRNSEEALWLFVEQVVEGSVETRDMEGLLERWLRLLNENERHPFSVWRSDRFQALISSKIEAGLTQNQICSWATRLSSGNDGQASLVVMDSILRGISRIETIDKLSEDGFTISLFQTLTKDLQSYSAEIPWQLLRVLLRLVDTWPALGASPEMNSVQSVVFRRLNDLPSVSQGRTRDRYKELSLTLPIAFILHEHSTLSVGELGDLVKGLVSLMQVESDTNYNEIWDGSFDTLATSSHLLVSFIYTLTARFMTGLSQIGPLLQQDFIFHFLKTASRVHQNNDCTNLRSAWASFVASESPVYEYSRLRDSLFGALLDALEGDAIQKIDIRLILEALTQCPLSILRRSQRESFIDRLFPISINVESLDEQHDILNVLIRLSQLPTNSSSLALSIGSEQGLYQLFRASNKSSRFILPTKIDLAKALLKHLVESRHHDRAESLLVAAITLASEKLSEIKIADLQTRAWAYSVIETISPLQQSDNEDPIVAKLDLLKTQLQNALIKSISSTAVERDIETAAWDLLFLNSLPPSEEVKRCLKVLNDTPSAIFLKINNSQLSAAQSQWLQNYARLSCTIVEESGKQATAIVVVLCEKGLYESVRPEYKSMVSGLSSEDLCNLLDLVSGACLPYCQEISSAYYTILFDILTIAAGIKPIGSALEKRITFTFSQLALSIPTCQNFDSLCIIINSINILLKQKAAPISQINVEETLASLAAVASTSSPKFEYSGDNTDLLFIPLCSIVSTILSTQRFRIKGRHSLVVATIQALMGLLFIPKIAGRRKTDTDIHPIWLTSLKTWVVTKEAGLAYCRLLTMLCDPSSSSVRMSRKASDLSSATVAARKAVEVHVPSLLRKYISLNLTHHLASDVRAALTPGLYAMFDVMQESTLRSLNMSLDNPGRVLFKSLYEDWNKFGKWKD
ncbi:hypothetical protein ABW19_dt0202154 [Dactylella cylindrospora]|nr:hypothetical protein ABW19_dt0202154 [Dactylella cylindrospora]